MLGQRVFALAFRWLDLVEARVRSLVLKARSRLVAIRALCLPCAAAALSSDLHLSCLPIHLTFFEIDVASCQAARCGSEKASAIDVQ